MSVLHIGIQLVFLQGPQELLNVLQLFYPGSIEVEDVIQIYNHKRVCEWSYDITHHVQKYC